MNQKMNPLTVLLILVGILVVIGGVYIFRNSQTSTEVQETSKRGEEVGKKMMMGGNDAAQKMMEQGKGGKSSP